MLRHHRSRLSLLVVLAGSIACKPTDSQKTQAAEAARAVREARAGQGSAPVAEGGDAEAAPVAGPQVSPAALLERARPMLGALPDEATNPDNPLTDEKIELGRMLYYDARLSKNHDVSCNTCHDLDKYGVDTRAKDGKVLATSLGHKKQPGERNSPTVYNAAFHLSQFWDGRAENVEEQAKGPILNPVEMAMPDEGSVIEVLKSIPGYVEKFEAAYPDDDDPITYDNMAKAIGAFERKLVTPAPFDAFMKGDLTAMQPQQLEGLKLFLDVGCITCHTGPTVGGTSYQKLGSVKPWPGLEDTGRFEITKSEADKFSFKVPSLRNVTKTGPYMHNGSVESLEKMIRLMAEHQTARGELQDGEVEAIMAFLQSLEGELPRDYIAKPQLPESGPKTPDPDPS